MSLMTMRLKPAAPSLRATLTLDILGPTIEFIVRPEDVYDRCCVIRSTVPPNVMVPLHKHNDFETHVMVAGEIEAAVEYAGALNWFTVVAGDVLHIPPGAKHAFHNMSDDPAVMVITSAARLGYFFIEAGRPLEADLYGAMPPSAAAARRLFEVAKRYDYWIASSEENAEIGLRLEL